MQKIFSVLVLLLLSAGAWAQHETSVLFIGNSFTFMNNMPFMFRDIAESEGHKIFVDTVVKGGKDLDYHAHNRDTYAKINSRKWDYVVIQGHSNELAQPQSKIDKSTLPFAQQIVDSIRENSVCTQVVVYMTWGYRYGNPKWAPIASYDSMQNRISNEYLRFADILNARVSPVGEVWKTIRANHSGLNLYFTDNQHPNILGSYVSACTFYATIFGESPLRNKAIIPIDNETKQIIEMTASQTVLNNLNKWRFVPKANTLESGFDMILTGRNLQVKDTSRNASWIEWNFGDGHVSTEKNPVHEYAEKGNYKVTQKISMHCRTQELVREIEIK